MPFYKEYSPPRGFITPQSTTFLRTGVSTGWRLSGEDCREANNFLKRFLLISCVALKGAHDKNKKVEVCVSFGIGGPKGLVTLTFLPRGSILFVNVFLSSY